MKSIINGCTINYFTIGEGVPVVMLHGFYLDHVVMKAACEPIFEELSGYKRIYFDLPGMGQSEAYEGLDNTNAMLEVVMAFIDKMLEGRPFALIGESYGGYLARGVLKNRPTQVLGLGLICPATEMDFEKRILPEPRVLFRDQSFVESLAPDVKASFMENHVIQNRQHFKRFENEIYRAINLANGPMLEKLQANGYGYRDDINADRVQYDIPALIITGRQDAVVGYDDTYKILDQYPRATFAILDGAGHNLQIEKTSLFNALVREWLLRLPK